VKAKQQVVAKATDKLQYKKALGVLWPITVYMKHHDSKKPHAKLISSHWIAGQRIRGVVLPPEKGMPLGTYELTGVYETGTERTGELANTDDMDEDQVEEVWRKGQQRQRVTPCMKQSKTGEAAVGLKTTTIHPIENSSDDDAIMEEIWGPRMGDQGADDADDGDFTSPKPDGGAKKRKSAAGAASSGRSGNSCKKSRAGGAEGLGGVPSPAARPSCSRKDLDISEQVLLSFKQLKGHLADNEEVLKILPSKATALQTKVAARLSPELVLAYSAEYAGGSKTTRGMEILEELQNARSDLTLIVELLDGLHPAKESGASGKSASDLQDLLKKVRDAGIIVASAPDEHMFTKFLGELVKEKSWEKYVYNINAENSDAMVTSVEAQRRKEVVQKSVVEVVVDYCRVTDEDQQKNALKDLTDFLTQVVPVMPSACNALAADARRMLTLLTTSGDSDMSDAELKAVAQAKEELVSNRAGMFFKTLGVLPMGKLILTRVSLASDQALKNKTCASELKAMQTFMDMAVPSAESLMINGEMVIPSLEKWQKLHTVLAHVKAVSSASFQASHALVIQTFVEKQQELVKAMSGALCSSVSSGLGSILDEISSAVTAEGGSNWSEVSTQLAEKLKATRPKNTLAKLDLKQVAPAGMISEIDEIIDVVDRAVGSLAAALPTLRACEVTGRAASLQDPCLSQLCTIYGKDSKILDILGGRGKTTHGFLKQFFATQVSKTLCKAIESFVPFCVCLDEMSDKESVAESGEEAVAESDKAVAKTIFKVELCGACGAEEDTCVTQAMYQDMDAILNVFLPFMDDGAQIEVKHPGTGNVVNLPCGLAAAAPAMLRFVMYVVAVTQMNGVSTHKINFGKRLAYLSTLVC
jgi:hypothetical protein